jgi:hypothetical protein
VGLLFYFVYVGLVWFSLLIAIISLNSINQLIYIMVNCVLFEVRTEFINAIYTNFGFDGLRSDIVLMEPEN